MRAYVALLFALMTNAAHAAAPAEPPREVEFTIVLAGDTGLNGSFEPVYATFGTKQGERLQWNDAAAAIAPEINGDINFANLETVVTDRNDLKANLKLFGFRTHPDGVRFLTRLGFNVFSTANNHAMDFGLDGARETLKQLSLIAAERGLVFAGLGANRVEAGAPHLMLARGERIALSALGIIGSGYGSPDPGEDRPGQLSYQSDRDLAEVADRLAAAKADYRILSVHYGQEFEPVTEREDRTRLRDRTLLARDLDLIVGHHQHVVAGVEIVGGKAIFYGLGNFLHWGTQDMSRFDLCRDYGLLVRVHVAGLPGERPTLRAIEAMPVTNMHRATTRMTGETARTRIHVLNYLAEQFDDTKSGSHGVRFALRDDGSGLYCAPGAERLAGRIGELCRAGLTVQAPAPALRADIERACNKRVVRIVEGEPEFEAEPTFLPALLPSE